jgi:hypothetical protein
MPTIDSRIRFDGPGELEALVSLDAIRAALVHANAADTGGEGAYRVFATQSPAGTPDAEQGVYGYLFLALMRGLTHFGEITGAEPVRSYYDFCPNCSAAYSPDVTAAVEFARLVEDRACDSGISITDAIRTLAEDGAITFKH